MVLASAFRRIGFGFAALALFFQLSLGAAVVDGAAMHRRLAASGLCHGDGPARHAPVHAPDCPLCPHGAALHVAAALPGGPVVLPAPEPAPVGALAPARGARAPPGFAFARAYPRGPPRLG